MIRIMKIIFYCIVKVTFKKQNCFGITFFGEIVINHMQYVVKVSLKNNWFTTTHRKPKPSLLIENT